ncbi:undecaprenyl-diphosphate phosphatase [Gordonia sp. NB41Y]|uniref:undecaprenyl-diphosphate phosphatase n=1 Tax=Gordonia sp. NB41Y TaxID=875808 RepID=UPI0002BDED1D|nr:undecaprenyl-diphosphate phosphatase [Gordonia sp. NB41Y]EMP11793.1 UDP pyrophosphate phosphatase [Gordonia sp. NB41Y]WLP90894.1 undecaprenyl-diphosphate phosphatase [Gordonia sp. NB41Y]
MTDTMTWTQSIVLGAIQGLTEFLPISSSGHLRIASELMFGQDAGASFTAVTQLGTEAAVLVFFARDIVRIVIAWFRGLFDRTERGLDYRIGWYVILATIPIGLLGYLLKDEIRTAARNLWLVATVLILFSGVFWLAEKYGTRRRSMDQLTLRDGLVMGLAQCLALVPGVSRSGATASAGLFLGLEREAAFRFSFLLAIPAVTASGLFSIPDAINPTGDGMESTGAQLIVATVVAFILGYASIAWLLKFVGNHSMNWFGAYRVILGLTVMGLLAGGVISAT